MPVESLRRFAATRVAAFPQIGAVPRWAILLVAALVARAATFGNPVVHIDEEFYFVTAQRMLEGALPYVDIWDRKPVGLFLLYVPAAAFGVPLGIWVYQAMALACAVATALVIARMAERVGWERGATFAALVYLCWLNFADGQGGQAPVFYNLLMAGAFLLALTTGQVDDARRRMVRGVAALALVGLALQVKYSVVFEGMFLGMWLMWREWRLGMRADRVCLYGACMVSAALVPTLAVLLTYAMLGHADAYLFANFGSILNRQADPILAIVWAITKLVLILAPLLAMSMLSLRTPVSGGCAAARGLAFGWLVAAMVGLVAFGGWFNHYALPVMVPAALCSAGFLGGHRTGRRLAMPIVAFGLIAGFAITISARMERGNAAQVQALADAVGRGPGCLYVYSGAPILYAYTGRCAPTAWVFPSHLSRQREVGAIGIDPLAEIDRIFTTRPDVVLVRSTYIGERKLAHDRTIGHLAAGYAHAGSYPLGAIRIDVYRRRLPGQAAATTGMARPLRLASTRSE